MTTHRWLLAAVAALALAGACTVPTTEEPVELSGSIVPETTTTTSRPLRLVSTTRCATIRRPRPTTACRPTAPTWWIISAMVTGSVEL